MQSWLTLPLHYEHHRAYERLFCLHQLTLAWISPLAQKTIAIRRSFLPPFQKEGVPPLLSFESMYIANIFSPFDPLKILENLSTTILQLQTKTLEVLLENPLYRPINAMHLAHLSWRVGYQHPFLYKIPPFRDIASLETALLNTPFFKDIQSTCLFIKKRKTKKELILLLKNCPHQFLTAENEFLAPTLCMLRQYWLIGFIYALNPQLRFQYSCEAFSSKTICTHHWHF